MNVKSRRAFNSGRGQSRRRLTPASACAALVLAVSILSVYCANGSDPRSADDDAGSPGNTSSIAGGIGPVWANDGGDKVTRDELRATGDPLSVLNSVWDGSSVSIFGGRNEVVSFNLILEAPIDDATDVTVTLDSLAGPDGASISTRPASGDDLFNFVGRNIELFYVRYLEIKGLSTDLPFVGYWYDERHIPERCRGPYDSDTGEGTGGWADRPCHNKFYPDIAVPLELESPFTITAGNNQSIWGDIYIPKSAPAGDYTGTISVTEDGVLTWQVPINLRVRSFALPDLPNARTMLYQSAEDINDRYLGEEYPEEGTPNYAQSLEIADRHAQLAHRHKISIIDDGTEIEQMDEAWTARLNGELFTAAHGYDGIGVGVGNNVYAVSSYGFPWEDGTQADMWTNTDPWVNWFDSRAFDTATDYFLYLTDEPEPDGYPQVEQWAQWMDDNPGPGQRLMSLATVPLTDAIDEMPHLDIVTTGSGEHLIGTVSEWEDALAAQRGDPGKRFFMYNGSRPLSGSFATEDDGVALRELAWGHYKKGVDRWFYWTATYYTNFACYGYEDPLGRINLFQQAQTFGCYDDDDDILGQTGWNYFNGDGVLFYPGTDARYPDDSYGVEGPVASLRLKHWRRGVQDVDYLAMAAAIDPTATAQIVDAMVPKVLWEYGSDPDNPEELHTEISWSTNPDDWEAARAELADIIEGAGPAPTVLAWGDSDCNGSVGSGDVLTALLFAGDLPTNQQVGCPQIGSTVDVQDASPHPWGDVDCNGSVNAFDALRVLRHVAALPPQPDLICPAIGSSLLIKLGVAW